MGNRVLVKWGGIVLGIVFLIIAVVYWAEPAGSLPHFFPGYTAGSSTHHIKHGIAAFVVAVACFVLAWFQSGPARSGADAEG